jgi:tetratricopeptide (TPR) repeat protein
MFFLISLSSHTRRYIFVFISFLLAASALHAQGIDAIQKLKLAQSFEQSGEWELAIPLYEDLLRTEPGNYVYFDGLRRSYAQMRMYEKAIALVERKLEAQPFDVVLLSSLGGLYYDSGSERIADSLWSVVVKLDPKNAGLYRVVASQMMEHRLYEKAAALYRAGRTATGNETMFADDLASLYFVLQQYAEATLEFIKSLRAAPQQLQYIQSRIASFTIRDQGLHAAVQVAKQEVKRTPDNIALHQLLAWLAMEEKDYQTALEEYRTIDRLSKANGAELFGFGRRASQDKDYPIAARAFREIVENKMAPAIIPQARFGYARALEDYSTENDTAATADSAALRSSQTSRVSETQKTLRGILELYEAIIMDYPTSELAGQAYYRIGIVRMMRLFDLDGALDAFAHVKKLGFSSQLSNDASLKTAEAYMGKNDLTAARAEYQSILRFSTGVYQQEAMFHLAELEYFEGQFDSSLAHLGQLSTNLMSDLSNDVLLLQYFIEENRTSNPVALADFTKADLLRRQRKLSEALSRFQDVVKNYPSTLLVDDATYRIAEIQLLLNRPNEALVSLQSIVKDMPTSILNDRAQMKIGEIYETKFRDRARAISAYEELLSKYPNSLFIEETRKRIRHLRGDSI